MFSRISTRTFSTSAARAIKVSTKAAVDSPVSSLKVVVKQAGSKSTPAGLSHLLASSAFLNTKSKSGLRLKREAELLGGSYKASVTRDALVLEATFLKEALPFFVSALSGVLTETSFKPHELDELVLPYATHVARQAAECPATKALEELHAVSFRRGLGQPLYYDGTKKYSSFDLATFAKALFTSDNIEVVGQNVDKAALDKFVAESALSKLPESKNKTVAKTAQKIYTGVESRIRQPGKTVAILGVPVSPEDIPSYELVAAAVYSAIPASYNLSVKTNVLPYEEAGLYYISFASEDASEVSDGLKKAAAALKKASGAKLSQYKPLAGYLAAISGREADFSSAKTVKVPKFNLVVVGDVDTVPLAGEL
ncbi:hypothetical protein BRETT_003527 [Brettanomyces bruxellensis]|uniref:Cytochrome b-c1 complex subunit 2, mitochondrial n=1 Tax=Dekkera bruxellensis TaxID=5007 RepID=A0A871RB79_DEKBR|nr:uncharacterized protein BRETT_003527 [Brettanomyces bruxellensis]QOU19380.1 hypothetical protein BRETT_003527 [Brettanomyces bruxellensis]